MIDIASQLLAEFPDALDAGADERCGVVRADGTIWQIANIKQDAKNGFIMEPKAFLEEVENGAIATFHTHPARDPNLSEEDMAGFSAWPQLTHHIIGLRDGKPAVTTYKVIEGGIVVNA